MPDFNLTKKVSDLSIDDCEGFRNTLIASPSKLYQNQKVFNKWYFLLPPSLEVFSKENFGYAIEYIVKLSEETVENNQKKFNEINGDVRKNIWLRFSGSLSSIKKGLLRLHLGYMGITNLDDLDTEQNNLLHYLSRYPVNIREIIATTLPEIYQILGEDDKKINDLYSCSNIYGETPIFAATLSAQKSNVEQYLMEMRSLDVNLDIKDIKTTSLDNLLHYATLSANKEFAGYVKQLVGNDAVQQSEFTRLENKDGLSSLDYFYFITNDETQGKLKSYAIDPDTLLNRSKRLHYISKVAHRLAQLKSPAVLRYFIEKYQLDINKCNRYDANDLDSGDTLLHTAALYASLQTVEYLIHHGADANKHNGREGTDISDKKRKIYYPFIYRIGKEAIRVSNFKALESPLHFAALSGNADKVQFLVEHGSNNTDNGVLEDYNAYAAFGGNIIRQENSNLNVSLLDRKIILGIGGDLSEYYTKLRDKIIDFINEKDYLDGIKYVLSWKTSLPLLAFNYYLVTMRQLSVKDLIDKKYISVKEVFDHSYSMINDHPRNINLNTFNYLFSLIGLDLLNKEIVSIVHSNLDLDEEEQAKEIFNEYMQTKQYL